MTNNKYGFGDDNTTQIKLPPPKQAKPKPTPAAVADAARAGEGLGFVPREPQSSPAAPVGRRRKKETEPQDKIFISGPARVIQAFRDHADAAGLTYWEALERLLDRGQP